MRKLLRILKIGLLITVGAVISVVLGLLIIAAMAMMAMIKYG